MNKLDTLLQSSSWKVEAQAVKAVVSGADGGESEPSANAVPVFDALLRKMAEKTEDAPARIQIPGIDAATVFPSSSMTEEDVADKGATGELLQDPHLDPGALPQPQAMVDNTAPQLDMIPSPQSLPLQQAAPAVQAASAPRDKSLTSVSTSLLDLIQLSAGKVKESDISDGLGTSSERKAMVIHQEAHFKPVLAKDAPGVAKSQDAAILRAPHVSLASVDGSSVTAADPAQEDTAMQRVANSQTPSETSHHAVTTHSEKDAAAAPTPHVVLHKIVSAIESDARRGPLEQGGPIRRQDASVPAIPAKPSDGVLRVLDIQLHPAELGVITVKMRLLGDKLEMELHASRDETVELLRKDSETLSGLLRTSGYRPDSVSIHTLRSDVAQPESMFGQRQSANPDVTGHFGNPQGGGAGHNGHPRGETEGTRSGSQGGQKNDADEITAAARSPGSLYL